MAIFSAEAQVRADDGWAICGSAASPHNIRGPLGTLRDVYVAIRKQTIFACISPWARKGDYKAFPNTLVKFGGCIMYRSRFALTAMLSMALLLIPRAWAQENATIVGTVVDASNAVVPNADITLINTATSQLRTATSNISGIYLFSNVGVGQFTLTATAKGFQKYTKTDIVVNTAQTLKEDITRFNLCFLFRHSGFTGYLFNQRVFDLAV
jgi:hypothetical protein